MDSGGEYYYSFYRNFYLTQQYMMRANFRGGSERRIEWAVCFILTRTRGLSWIVIVIGIGLDINQSLMFYLRTLT